MRQIPKRPSGRLQSYRKRIVAQPSEQPTISLEIAKQLGQPVAYTDHSLIQHDELADRFALSDLATIKSEAIKPQEPFERKKKSISYPAVVNARRPARSSIFDRVISSLLK